MSIRNRLCIAALLTTLTAGPVLAQTTAPTTTSTTTPGVVRTDDRREDHSNWGWLGLLGLAGLAPLFMRKDRQGNVHADTRR